MGRQRESRTGIAVLAFIVATAVAQFNSPSDLRGDCTDKVDGIYPTGNCIQSEPSGVLIDCATLADGLYTSGCTHAFVQCSSHNAFPLECQAGLVFDKRVNKCVWPSECSSEVVSTLPIVAMPSHPSDIKKEKEDMVTDAPLPQLSNDGAVCTGTGRRAMGKCSSGFVQCIGGKFIARRCPGQSLFDEKIGLCVYDVDDCEMDVDIVDVADQETTVSETTSPLQDIPSGSGTQPVESTPSTYTQQVAQDTSNQQQYSQSTIQQDSNQNGYESQDSTPYQRGYQTVYQSTPTMQYQTEHQSPPQQYQNGVYETMPEYGPIYSSFGDSSLSSQSQSTPQCHIGSFRRVSACSSSFDSCSPTARQWIRRVCGKSHRFDSSTNRCRPIFEVRECDEPMSSYIPPPVESIASTVYSNPSTSFEYPAPVSGKEYEEKQMADPFKGGYQTGRMESNPFIATGNSGSFYTEDGFSWIGSPWNEGRERRRGGRRSHKNGGDYVIVSGNPFGGHGNRVLNDEWKGRRNERKGAVRSSLADARGHRVRNVMDQFEGHVSHFAPPLGEVNPFAVKRADGHRRRGRKNCRRDRRREDWDDYECDEKREKERPTARNVVELSEEDDDERPMQMEENENTESIEISGDEEEKPVDTEGKELEKTEETEEEEDGETDPELMPESIENEKIEETNDEVNEDEKEEAEETTTEGESIEEIDEIEEKNEDNEEVKEEPLKDEENVEERPEERPENESEETANAVEELNEDNTDKESEENDETEPETEDVESPESVENSEEKVEDVKDEEKNEIDEDEDVEEKEEAEDISENGENRVDEEEKEDTTTVSIEEAVENVEEDDNEKEEKEETSESIENDEDAANEEMKENSEVKEDETEETEENETESMEDGEEKVEAGEPIEESNEEIDNEGVERSNENAEKELELKTESGEDVNDEVPENIEEKIEEEEEIKDEVDNEEVEETASNGDERTTKDEEESETMNETEEKNEDNEEVKEESLKDEENVEKSPEKEKKEKEETDETEKVEEEEELNEDDVDKEFEEDAESNDASKSEDVEVPESLEKEEKEENEQPGITMKFEENGEKTEEKEESTPEETAEGDFDMNPASIEVEDEDVKNKKEEVVENETEETANVVEELNEDNTDKELEENDETEPENESKTEDVESPESVEDSEEKVEDVKDDEKNGDEIEENDDVEETQGDNEDISENGENRVDEEEKEETSESIENDEENAESDNNNRRRRSVVYDTSVANEFPSPSSPTISRRLSIPRSSRLHRSRFSRLCSSSTAGHTISIGQCRQDFVYCKSARRPVVAACPVGDLFDAVMSTCVPTEICGAEATKMVIPTETPLPSPSRDSENPTMPSPTVSTTHKTVVIDDNKNADCSLLSDGAYPLSECSSRYFVCAFSKKNSYKCPAGLFYDKPTDSCQWPADVIGCNGRDTISTATSSYSSDTVDRDIIATTAPSTVSPMHVHFECSKDGGFALDCKGGFVMCSNGAASIMRCPPALVFEDSSQACQYPSHVASCGLAPTSSPSSSLDVPSTTSSTPSSVYIPSTPTTLPTFIYSTSSTASPARAVEILVNTPLDKNACSRVSTGLEGKNEVCSTSFNICKEGQVITTLNCPEGTFFDEKTKNCDYREIACDGGGNREVVEQDMSTVSTASSDEYNRRASRPYRPLTPVGVEKIEERKEVKRDEEKPVVIQSYIESTKESNCEWEKTVSSGDCSSKFIVCSNGRPEVFDCTAGLVFSSAISACQYPQFVPGCPQFEDIPSPPTLATPSSTVSSISDAVIVDDSISEYTRDEDHSTTTARPIVPSKIGEHTSARFEATGDACSFSAKQPAFPLNYCSMTYAVCTADERAFRTNCTFGYLFDSVIRQCVPSEHCGQPYMKEIGGASPPSFSPLNSMNHLSHDSRCVQVKDGTLKATSLCSAQYIRCEKESVVMVSCSSMAHVFSPLTGRCVLRVQMAECSSSSKGSSTPAITLPKIVSPSTVSPTPSLSSDSIASPSYSPPHRGSRIRGGLSFTTSSTPFDARTFCTTKHSNGLYRHPENCAGIIQCFGGEVFSYPSCAPGLFFNEIDSQCDYASNVPECASQSDPISLDDSNGSCKGQPHGSHLSDDSDCSIYYRCVWGSMERLSCPEGTVFNPRLSVCDYPSEVPHCNKH